MNSTISQFAARLRCLEIQIVDDRTNLDEKILGLSELLEVSFREAVNLQNLHIGFGQRVSVPLETVFHHIHFKKLAHIGLHLWLLNSVEIIEMLDRHKDTLKSLRLRHISLREGTWKEVLEYIRQNLGRPLQWRRPLEWLSLRGVGYERNTNLGGLNFGPGPATHGNLMHNDSNSESDIDSDINRWSESNDDAEERANLLAGFSDVEEQPNDGGSDGDDEDSDNDSTSAALSDVNHQSQLAIELARPSSISCRCDYGYAWSDLVDNGVTVQRIQWKMWEKWAISSCSQHDPAPPADC